MILVLLNTLVEWKMMATQFLHRISDPVSSKGRPIPVFQTGYNKGEGFNKEIGTGRKKVVWNKKYY
jgi:hypothetical protein